jgi:hypothetical protein
MSNTILAIKQHDTKQTITGDITLSGNPVDLTACSVYLVAQNTRTKTSTVYTGSIVTPTSGSVSYDLSSGSFGELGIHKVLWKVKFPDNTILHTPQSDYFWLVVEDDLV